MAAMHVNKVATVDSCKEVQSAAAVDHFLRMTRLPTTPNPNSWRAKLGGAVRGGAAARTILTTVRIRRIGGRGTPGGDGGNGGVALWQQGAEELYSSELVAKRAAARHDVAVLDVLQTWWDTARRSMMLGDSSKICEVPEIQYVAMMKKIYRVVIDEYDEDDATACASDDWARDAKGCAGLTREMFQDAMFEARPLVSMP